MSYARYSAISLNVCPGGKPPAELLSDQGSHFVNKFMVYTTSMEWSAREVQKMLAIQDGQGVKRP